MKNFDRIPVRLNGGEQGMALVVSLVFLLLLTLIGISSMQNATLQEKMSGSVKLRNESFQFAESALRMAETLVQVSTYAKAVCVPPLCVPPSDSNTVVAAGASSVSGVTWVATGHGFYSIQSVGTTVGAPANIYTGGLDVNTHWTFFRLTGVGIQGNSRTVLESIYVKKRSGA
ncbi:PilX N-terminal domain-containing pilus assembly protein [Pseudomonas sp. RTC3]|uniref:pilus assembly PilX family protein n=1 Tax=unclassified Pseudomonas TaxID=196821 RepID=UPI002AB5A37F|nr:MULTISPECIES: PilX N-terminal domain-containing pilus assembly protein [unclassified Pseudomonas]MEB0065107.1 PilX N-terminal domain-containing pilus assembly protein [Pseudomonas sp. RTC3]MDY7566517.1 PilX N-terminal domain-containing pilus assembly protein [Pseudomonas sp. 5C2]MEB0009000.1 PilX N-terminal domain-containing pilus assembly protein [Pseudomonas sp. RTB2]MEB0016797.1 PilX N-terminal domain-containing pilus assembly protein [Pseudomonas sp. RTB3]MEB0024886.1 PilX N-terminal do